MEKDYITNMCIPDAPELSELLNKTSPVFKSKASDQFEPVRLHFLINACDDAATQKYIEFNCAKALNYSVYGMTPFMIALARHNLFIAKLLVQHGCEISSLDMSKCNDGKATKNIRRIHPIHMAAQYGDSELLKLMLDQDASLIQSADLLGFTPLHHAAAKGKYENVEALIHFGAHVNAQDNRRQTSLHRACEGNHFQTVQVLIEAGAVINIPDLAGWTPAFTCVVGRCVEILELLISLGARVNIVDLRGRTMLHASCMCTDLYNLNILALNNQDYKMQQLRTSTPNIRKLIGELSSENSSKNSLSIIRILLNHPHFKLDVEDYYEKTAVEYAIVDRLFDSALLLLKEGAKPPPLENMDHLQKYIEVIQEVNFYKLEQTYDGGLLSDMKVLGEMLSLKILCRKEIRRYLPWYIDSRIDELPLPHSLKNFLKLR